MTAYNTEKNSSTTQTQKPCYSVMQCIRAAFANIFVANISVPPFWQWFAKLFGLKNCATYGNREEESFLKSVYNEINPDWASWRYVAPPTWWLTAVAKKVEVLIDFVQRVYRHCVYVPHSSDIYIKHFDTGVVYLILHKRVELLLLQYSVGLS